MLDKKLNIAMCIICAILIGIIMSLMSCGARHVQTETTKEKIVDKIVDTSKIITKDTISTKLVDNSIIDNFTIEPKDTTKPFQIDGHIYKNVVIKHEKKKNNISVDKTEKIAKIEQKAIINEKATTIEVKQKEIERKSSYWCLLWLLLLIPIYLVWKNKDKIWYI